MRKNVLRLLALLSLFVFLLGGVVNAQEPVTITWFIGLGTGGAPEQLEAQQAVVDAFNASHDDIQIEIIVVENNVSVETLSTLIATGEAPDIVGPVGNQGAAAFRGNFLDIEPLVESTGYDLSQFPEASVAFQRDEEGTLLGLPLANFPAFVFYRPALFDEAGLEYPPAAYGEPYVLDGEEVPWDVNTLREVAMILTVDANGNDATMEEFDPENVIQWGFINQWADPMRQIGTMFGAGSLVDEEGNAVFPDNWRIAFEWFYNGVWEDHFIPNAAQVGSDLLGAGNAFASGNVAMAQSHLWYTCCLADTEWDAAPMPSYEGTITARLHADTFRIMNTTENAEAAFEVLTYLTGEASLDLLATYGGMPARPGDQQQFFDKLDEKYTQGVNWDVVKDSLNYPDIPSHEAWLPNNNKANDRINAFSSLLTSTPGLDLDAEIETLISDLQAIYDEFYAQQGS
ncbi:MAG: extracellular solute-binding protein [Anaerolineae bacterium]